MFDISTFMLRYIFPGGHSSIFTNYQVLYGLAPGFTFPKYLVNLKIKPFNSHLPLMGIMSSAHLDKPPKSDIFPKDGTF